MLLHNWYWPVVPLYPYIVYQLPIQCHDCNIKNTILGGSARPINTFRQLAVGWYHFYKHLYMSGEPEMQRFLTEWSAHYSLSLSLPTMHVPTAVHINHPSKYGMVFSLPSNHQ